MNKVYAKCPEATSKGMPYCADVGEVFICKSGGYKGNYFMLTKIESGTYRLVDLSDGVAIYKDFVEREKCFEDVEWERVTKAFIIEPRS